MMVKDQSYGIIPLREREGIWFVLLIRHLSGHWSFPKGHPKSGETPKEAAERELTEESGLVVKRYLSESILNERYRFRSRGKLIDKGVGYYIAEVEGEVKLQVDEVVDHKWVPVVSAEAHVSFPEAKRMLAETYKLLLRL